MQRFALRLAAALLSATAVQAASPYPIHIERQHGSTLIIEHTPVPARIGVRKVYRSKVVRVRKARPAKIAAVRKVHRRKIVREAYFRNPALAGGCHDGGYVRRQLRAGPVVVLHRDVCEGIAPISSLPGLLDR
jgi:hypothetical protein